MQQTTPPATMTTPDKTTDGTPVLPPPVSGERHDIDSSSGRIALFSAGPDVAVATADVPDVVEADVDISDLVVPGAVAPGDLAPESDAADSAIAGSGVSDIAAPERPLSEIPLLLLHSINAAGSAYEIRPLYEHYRKTRPVYALEMPGFGHSQRGERKYTARMMTYAVHAAVKEIQESHPGPIDALGLSLSCEFVARAAHENPAAFRSLALVSPTGFDSRPVKWIRGTRGKPWLHSLLEGPPWDEGFFRLLTTKPVIGWFLKKTWGADNYDRGLQDYDYLTTHQPGAHHAPYYFVSGFLFSQDILRIYQSLTMPVWMCHGSRGDFVDYRNKSTVEDKPNWSIHVYPTGAMPQFEVLPTFTADYDGFVAAIPASQAT